MSEEEDLQREAFAEALRASLFSDGGEQPGGFAAASDDPQDGEFQFATVSEAEQAIDGPQGALGGGVYLRRVADWIIEREDVSGTPKAWHNFITSYLSQQDFPYALKLSQHALERYPYDIDLLGSAIQAACSCAEWETGRQLVETANAIPKRFWNWYLSVWACAYYMRLATACDPAQRSDVLGQGIELIRACREQLPLEDRIYNQEAEILLADNRIDEARAVLESAIYHEHDANDGTSCMIPAAQCCLTYLNSILHGVNDYARIIDIAQRGTKNAADEHESVNTGYFLYREALALDGSIHEEEEKNHAKGFGNQELVKEALNTYVLAYKLNKNGQYRAIIRKRFDILCGKSGITGFQLPEDE